MSQSQVRWPNAPMAPKAKLKRAREQPNKVVETHLHMNISENMPEMISDESQNPICKSEPYTSIRPLQTPQLGQSTFLD